MDARKQKEAVDALLAHGHALLLKQAYERGKAAHNADINAAFFGEGEMIDVTPDSSRPLIEDKEKPPAY